MAHHTLVMGVCGTGKSTVASRLAARLGRPFVEADDHHAAEAIARMARGEALTDADRWGWLDRISGAALAAGPSVIGCSALKRAYRDRLEATLGPMDVLFLDGPRALIAARMAARTDHYMPTSLLDSQLATLEPPAGDRVTRLDIAEPVDRLVDAAYHFATRSRTDA